MSAAGMSIVLLAEELSPTGDEGRAFEAIIKLPVTLMINDVANTKGRDVC